MSWVSFVLTVVSLLNSLVKYLHDNKVFKEGQTKEIADALAKASAEIQLAINVEVSATKKHEADKTDEAFDQEFERK